MARMTEQEIREVINSSGGRIFTCTFIKRGDGSLRTMRCRIGVHKYVTGEGMHYDTKEYGLVTVFDMDIAAQLRKEGKDEKKAYRNIPIEGIVDLKVDGDFVEVE